MVSIPVYPGNGRRQSSHIDISSWTNKANIIVPESKTLEPSQYFALPSASFFLNEREICESDSDELTDDETFLIRHEKAFADYMNQSY